MTGAGVPSLRVAPGRKLIHLSTAILPVAWSYGLLAAADVRILLAAALGAGLGVEWGRKASPALRAHFNALVGPLLKPQESTTLTGATWLAAAMLLAAVILPERAAIVALWAGAVGDPAAALVGRAWQSRAARAATEKSFAGSATCALVTALGALWLAGAAVLPAAMVGAAAAIAEWPLRLGDDNLRVTLAAGAAAWLLRVG